MDPERIREKGIRELPGTLGEAIDELERDEVIGEALGEHVCRTSSRPSARSGTSTARRSPNGRSSATSRPSTLSRDLQRRGFRFVGPTIVYAFMQAVGLVDDHLPGCFRYSG
jgi:3-methyladenine DNA glycosylase Tag